MIDRATFEEGVELHCEWVEAHLSRRPPYIGELRALRNAIKAAAYKRPVKPGDFKPMKITKGVPS